MKGFEKAAQVNDVTPAVPKRIKIGQMECVLFKEGDHVYAIENICPHQHYSIFHQAIKEGFTITCPMHGWRFDIRNGEAVQGSGHLKILEVRLDKDDVWIKLPEEEI
jgi:nitrite reductase/ring-hydroxylating ferredoxin subunit